MLLNMLVGAVLALFALIGFFIGLGKGYTNARTWAGEYVISSILAIIVGAVLKKLGVDVTVAGIVTLGSAVVLILFCMMLSGIVKNSIKGSLEKREREMRRPGAAGVINRIWGGVALAIKGFCIAAFIMVPIVLVLEFAHISAVSEFLTGITEGAFWIALKPRLFDLVVLGAINIAIRQGYVTGISGALWKLFVLALIVGAGVMSYNLVFTSGMFEGASAALGSKIESFAGQISFLNGMFGDIAKWIITAGLFILLAIVILIVSFFVTKVLNFARLGAAFYVVDGILGAAVMFVIALAIMLFIGYLIQPIAYFDFMAPFTGYFENSVVARFIYTDNLLLHLGVPVLVPLQEWLS